MRQQLGIFDEYRITMRESVEYTVNSLLAYGATHRHWAIAWSGGKDSTTLLTVVLWLLDSGRVPWPDSLAICYADTRMELPPLAIAANAVIERLEARGIRVLRVMAPLDRRFFVYMLGRGVPPPRPRFRWCTGQMKINPMSEALRVLHGTCGEKVLMLTGVRQGESAIRDGRIAMSCGRDGAECGQGWYQETLPGEMYDTLAPILHWRVCQVWEWLRTWAPKDEFGGWEAVEIIADAYGGDEAEEINARTGCLGCTVASKDAALDAVLRIPEWQYLAPLKGLRILFEDLFHRKHRLRKQKGETYADGSLFKKQCRLGPLVMPAREMALARVLGIQETVNRDAVRLGRPCIDLLNAEEVARIHELIAANTWPDRWTGDEQRGDMPFDDGCSLFGEMEVGA
jgi:DNA sulfur modification protein DndC